MIPKFWMIVLYIASLVSLFFQKRILGTALVIGAIVIMFCTEGAVAEFFGTRWLWWYMIIAFIFFFVDSDKVV